MTRSNFTWAFAAASILVPLAFGQLPLLHYPFNEGTTSGTMTRNVGTFSPGLSTVISHTTLGTGIDGMRCMSGGGAPTQGFVATPLLLNQGNNSWTIGFSFRNASAGFFQTVFGDASGPTGFQAFAAGAAGSGNMRIMGGGLPTVDIVGGAPASTWVHVAWVHDTVANQLRAYLNGALVSTTSAPSVNLTSGMPLLIGGNQTSDIITGTRIDEFRFYDYPLTTSQVATWATHDFDPSPDFQKTMLTEVSPVAPRGIEITNHSTGVFSLTDWRIRWINPPTVVTSDPINVTLNPGTSVVVMAAATTESFPLGTQVVNRFPGGIPPVVGEFSVGLVDPIGNVRDELLMGASGSPPTLSTGGVFRGVGPSISGVGNRSVERIWGLDSNGGSDWTEQAARTFGRENTSDGARGTDPASLSSIRINEIDDSPDYIELFNPGLSSVDLTGWFLLMASGQGGTHAETVLPAGTTIPATGYLVIGESLVAPPELPGAVPYVIVTNIPFTGNELECALYDELGRLIDLVRAGTVNAQEVRNFPRAPSHWADFTGGAGRNLNGGDDATGRSAGVTDTNAGSDFFPLVTRTMGSSNAATNQAGPGGFGNVLDVRLNETGLGNGFQAIINAGPSAAGLTYNFILSTFHSGGFGPILGLGGDVFANFATYYHVAPFWGTLGPNGSARIEFDPGILPPGVDADFIFFLQDASNTLVRRTLVLEFDT